jgi:hypothetical protein
MVLRIRYRTAAGYVHCRVFSAKAINHVFALVGTLIFREDEWATVQTELRGAPSGDLKVQIVPEES